MVPDEISKTVMTLVENCVPISVVIHGLFLAFGDHSDIEVWLAHNYYMMFNHYPLPLTLKGLRAIKRGLVHVFG